MTLLKKPQQRILVLVLLITTVIVGYFLSNYLAKVMRADEASNLLLKTEMIALLIEPEEVLGLYANDQDLENPVYLDLKRDLTKVRIINKDIRFIYLIGLNENRQQFFYVDSESRFSEDYSAPGDLYLEATREDIVNHLRGSSYTAGPYTDRWGEWFSAYAPVLDDQGNVLALVGADMYAKKMLLRVNIVRRATILIFALIFCSILLAYVSLKERKNK